MRARFEHPLRPARLFVATLVLLSLRAAVTAAQPASVSWGALAEVPAFLGSAPPALGDPARMEVLARAAADLEVARLQQETDEPTTSGGSEKLARVRHGFWSLLIPGWSQFRAGHTTRGFIFLSIEAAVWTSYIVFESQGQQRENAYEDYAVQFAQVQGTDRDDDYWRAVASYRTSDEYNEVVRRELRAGTDPDGGEYTGEFAWRWQNERRFDDYQELRRSSNEAYDSASMVLMFALINRAAAFVDALRDGGGEPTQADADLVGMDVKLSVKPSLHDPTATVSLQRHF
jgi:hypothetical protein